MKKVTKIIIMLMLIFVFTGCNNSNENFSLGIKYIEKNMYLGEQMLLEANITELETGETIEWKSSDEGVATVTDGLVVAVKVGKATITAKLGEHTSVVRINVYEKEIEEELFIEIEGLQTVLLNETITLTATVSSQTASQNIKWSSSDEEVATVDQSGVVKGIKPGVVTIRATSISNSKYYKEITILVRTGDGIQDIIYNYINQNIYITTGSYNLETLNETVVNMVKDVERSVIGVSNFQDLGEAGTGTGGIYNREQTATGYKYTVFTNHHVIEDANEIKVYLGDLDEYVTATLIKSDADLDLAIITFEHTELYEPLKFGEIGDIKNGDFVVAIGNPGGYTYYGTVTFGMISCYNRKMKDSTVTYVQHDTPINPGNSGGPLFNLEGEVIGINTLKLAASDIEGMGFSIAMETFLEYLEY